MLIEKKSWKWKSIWHSWYCWKIQDFNNKQQKGEGLPHMSALHPSDLAHVA